MKAVIMAGGKGTRISSITNDEIPKPMLKIGDKTILEHQIDCLKKSNIDEIILVIGHLGEKIKDYFKDGTNFGVKISYYEEDPEKPLGTAGSFYYLKDKIDEDFILVFGDVFLSVDFTKMVSFHKINKSDATLLTHPNSHPFDSDLVVAGNDNKVKAFDSKENKRDYDYKNLVNSGIYCFSKRVFDYVTEPKKYGIEKDVISKMIESGDRVYSYHSTEYVKDMGTPERFYSVNEDYNNCIPEHRNLSHKQKAIFLDRDGTINVHIPFLVEKDKFQLIEGASEAIKKINSSEYLCIVVTNQPIIARGESTVENLEEIHKRMETLLGKAGAYIDGLYYCPHHKDKGFPGEVPELKFDCDCRKPKIGMLLKAAEDFNIDLSQSIVIGDSTLDIKMAENACMQSILVKTGQSGLDGKYLISPTEETEDLLDAVNLILTNEERKKEKMIMLDFKKAITEYYEREMATIKRFNLDEINESMNAILETYENGGTIYVCGNGGSASTASHMQNDFNKGISEYTDKKFNFYCLNDNVSTMMAVANDIGYEEVFRFPLINKITSKDLFIGISGSGNSKNVLNAAEYAKECGAKVVGITGYSGGKLKELADYKMHVDEMDMQIAEDLHMTFDHMMMKIFYNYLTKNVITGNNINDKH